MRRASPLSFAALVLPFASACASAPGEAPFEPKGPVAEMIARAAEANGVPAELMAAVAHIEGGLRLAPIREVDGDELVPIAGVLELRHGHFNSLARGALLMDRTELDLSIETALGTEAGARVLDDLARDQGIARGDMAAWASVVEELSGYRGEAERADYRARVFKVLRHGGRLPARDGEVITLPPRDDVPIWLTLSPPQKTALGEPEYPGAIWFETPQNAATSCGSSTKKYDTTRNGFTISMIAIHDTEGGWDASVSTLQFDPCKSVHYIVDADGSRVGQFIPESYTGWHVGNYHYNQQMVGIEHVGYASKDDYDTKMYAKSADLVKVIAARYGLPVDRSTLIAHQEVPNGQKIASDSAPCTDSPGSCVGNVNYGGANHHTDPGVYWEWCQYMELAGGTCKCNDAYELWNCVHDLSMMVRCPEGNVEIVHCADTCVVEPIGTNDHCTPVSSSGAGGSGGGGSSSSTGTGVGGGGGEGGPPGAGGNPGGEGGHNDGNHDTEEDSSCAVSPGSPRESPLAAWSALAVAAAFAMRSRRRAAERK